MGSVVINGNTFPIYGTQAGAIAYLDARLGSTDWVTADTNDQKRSLVAATRWLDRGVIWNGTKTDPAQGLQFPREGLVCDGTSVPSDEVPVRIEQATYELALVLFLDPTAADTQDQGSNIASVGAGAASVSFFRPTIGGEAPRFPVPVMELVRCFVGSGISGSFAFGTDQESQFDLTDRYGLTEGFK
jgi:hypothetical protein